MQAEPLTSESPARLDQLRQAVRTSFPDLDADAQRVSLAIYRRLAKGRPVTIDELALEPELPSRAEIESLLDEWPAVHRDDDGAVVGYWGLALSGTGHRIEVDGVQLTTWCAWDTLFLPDILEATVDITSPCPVTGEDIVLQVSPRGVEKAHPAAPVLSFLDPRDKIDDGVISAFCHHIHFFTERAAGEHWVSTRDDALLLSLEEGWALAREANLARYGETLSVEEPESA